MPQQPTHTLIASPRNPRIMQVRKLAARKERSRSGLFFAEGIRLVSRGRSQWQRDRLADRRPGAIDQRLCPRPACPPGGPRRASAGGHGRRDAKPLDAPAPAGPRGGGPPALAPPRHRPTGATSYAGSPSTPPGTPAMSAPSSARSTRLAAPDSSSSAPPPTRIIRRPCAPAWAPSVPSASSARRLPSYAPGSKRTGTALSAPPSPPRATMTPYPTPPRSSCSWAASGKGYRPIRTAACDDLLRLPMVGHVDSLNLAVATGVVLYEIFRQRQHPAR